MSVEVAVPVNHYRHLSLDGYADSVRQMQASGVVDQMQIWDQMTRNLPFILEPEDSQNWLPRSLEVCRLLKGR